MTQYTPISNLPWPELTDIPNAQTAFQNLANAIDGIVVPRFATATARDSAITAPVAGQMAFTSDFGLLWQYDGGTSTWKLASPYRTRQTLSGTTASVTFSGMPTNLRRLRITYTCRSSGAGANDTMLLRVNADTTAGHYHNNHILLSGTVVNTYVDPATTAAIQVATLPATTASAGSYCFGNMDIMGWDNVHTSTCGVTYHAQTYDTTSAIYYSQGGGAYLVAGPYTSVTLLPGSGSFVSGSEFILEGWD